MTEAAPLGANVTARGVEFGVWAPHAGRVELVADGRTFALTREDGGTWRTLVPDATEGSRYGYLVDGQGPYPDPYSRSQPDGPHAPSEVIDPRRYTWRDAGWRGVRIGGLVIYELHVGTFTQEGTFDAAIAELPRLRDLGVGAIELMPVAEFPGGRNWGYDGVDLFAPSHVYGGAEALRRLVDAAHAFGIGVILDVVYNHLGPDGNYLRQFSSGYFTSRYDTPWGEAFNYDGPGAAMVRRYVCDNATHWLREYHIDGLRLDAAYAIHDSSPIHILAELSEQARASVDRHIVLIAETYENDPRYVTATSDGGHGLDAVWADDFHHALHTMLTGERDGYYAAYDGRLSTLAATVNQGWLNGGGESRGPEGRRRYRSVPAPALVYSLQNHDQVGNRASGERLSHLVPLDRYRAAVALMLLLPYTPMLFMGEEFAATSPFQYFTDHHEELGRQVTEGRRREFARFRAFADPGSRDVIPDPQHPATFERSKLRTGEWSRSPHREIQELYRDILALRRTDAVIARQDRDAMRAVALSDDLMVVVMASAGERRLLAVNFGEDAGAALDGTLAGLDLGAPWRELLCTDARRYGGSGGAAELEGDRLRVPARAAALLAPG